MSYSIFSCFTMSNLSVFFVHTKFEHLFMDDHLREHFNSIARNSLQDQKLHKIKSNAHDLDDVLTFRVNSALKKEFSRICKENQSSSSSELKRYMLFVVKQGHL